MSGTDAAGAAAHCDRCPLKRHRRPCPARWGSCGDACALAETPDGRAELIGRSKPRPSTADVQLLRENLPSAFWAAEGLDDETVTIFLPLSGRESAWCTHLSAFLDVQAWPRKRVRLVLADTSQDDAFSRRICSWLKTAGYPHARYYRQVVGAKGLAGKPRPNDGGVEVNAALRAIYARMVAELDTRFVLVVEDDHRPPPNTVERLLRGFDRRTAAVSGLYRGREPAGHWVAWAPWQDRVRPELGPAIAVHGSGFGTVVIRRDPWLVGETFAHQGAEPFPYDIGFCQRVQSRGGVWKVARDVLSHHAGAPAILPADLALVATGMRPAERRATARQMNATAALVNACPYRGCKVGCGNASCRAGRGDQSGGKVASFRHCVESVRQCMKETNVSAPA